MNMSFLLDSYQSSTWRSTTANRKHLQLACVSFYLARRSKRKELWADMLSSISLNPLTLRLGLFPVAGAVLISMNQRLNSLNHILGFLFFPSFILVFQASPILYLGWSHAWCHMWEDESVTWFNWLPPLSHLRFSHWRWRFAASLSERDPLLQENLSLPVWLSGSGFKALSSPDAVSLIEFCIFSSLSSVLDL